MILCTNKHYILVIILISWKNMFDQVVMRIVKKDWPPFPTSLLCPKKKKKKRHKIPSCSCVGFVESEPVSCVGWRSIWLFQTVANSRCWGKSLRAEMWSGSSPENSYQPLAACKEGNFGPRSRVVVFISLQWIFLLWNFTLALWILVLRRSLLFPDEFYSKIMRAVTVLVFHETDAPPTGYFCA